MHSQDCIACCQKGHDVIIQLFADNAVEQSFSSYDDAVAHVLDTATPEYAKSVVVWLLGIAEHNLIKARLTMYNGSTRDDQEVWTFDRNMILPPFNEMATSHAVQS